jgi:Flp pilus assembly protein TadD
MVPLSASHPPETHGGNFAVMAGKHQRPPGILFIHGKSDYCDAMIRPPTESLIAAENLRRHGQFTEAESIFRELLQQHPTSAEAWHQFGILCQQLNRPAEARKYIAQATALDPKNPAYWNNLGQSIRTTGQLAQAEACFREAIGCDANSPLVWINLSLVLSQTVRFTEAAEAGRRAVTLGPELASAHAALGQAFSRDDPHAALEAFKQSLHLDPKQPDALNNVGVVLMDLGRYEDALGAFEKAVRLAPEFPLAWNNLGIALGRMNRGKEALQAFERAVALNPNYVAAHTNRATAWMLLGDLQRGWQEYEWRWAAPPTVESVPRVLDQPLPKIDGQINLSGKTVLVYAEQGYGDIIQYIRYVRLLALQGAKIILSEVPTPVVLLLQSVQGVQRVVERGGETPAQLAKFSDYQINLMSLPRIFGTTLQNIPGDVPYLGPTPERVRHWREKIGEHGKMKIGLRWAGNPIHTNDFSRTVAPKLLEPLLAKPEAIFYSLQTDRLQFAHENLVDFTNELTDFAETAALIANLDLVISVDTAVAHLAGAMGKPTWTLLPFGPEFRWLQDRSDSPWYPTMRLFCQTKLHDWTGVIEKIVAALEIKN